MSLITLDRGDAASRLTGQHWSSADAHRGWTIALVASLMITAALAVIGLPPISLHGPNHYVGLMAPTCGMTRAVRFLAMGDLSQAWSYNPAVFLLAAAGVAGAARTAVGVVAGRWWNPQVRSWRAAIVIGVLVMALLWSNQQAHSDLLRGP